MPPLPAYSQETESPRTWHRVVGRSLVGFAPLLLLSGLLFALHFWVYDKLPGDDMDLSRALHDKTLFAFLRETYNNWSGRLATHGATVLLINHVPVWRLLNSLIFIALARGVAKVALHDHDWALSTSFSLAVIFLLPPFVLGEGGTWITGSFNYLWPATFGIWGFTHFILYSKNYAPLHRVLLIAFSSFAAYSEQVAIITAPLALAWTIWLGSRRRLTWWHVLHCVMIGANATILFLAPGQAARFDSETRTWYPDFETLGLLDKLGIGIDLLLTHIYDRNNLLIQLCAILTFVLVLKSAVSKKIKAVLLAGCTAIALPALIKLANPSPFFDRLYTSQRISVENYQSLTPYLHTGLLLLPVLLLLTGIHLVSAKKLRFSHLQIPLITAAAPLTIIAMGFSPTAYVSGPRVFFIHDVVICLTTCSLVQESAKTSGNYSPSIKVMLPIIAIAAIRMVNILSSVF